MPKKKGRKRAPLTEEERLLMMQQKHLAEEELNKKKEDMLAQFLKVPLISLDLRVLYLKIGMQEDK